MQALRAQPDLAAGGLQEKTGNFVEIFMRKPGSELQLKAFDSAPELSVCGKYDGFRQRHDGLLRSDAPPSVQMRELQAGGQSGNQDVFLLNLKSKREVISKDPPREIWNHPHKLLASPAP